MIKKLTLSLIVLALISACSSNRPAKLNLMAAPEIYHDDRFAPFDDEDLSSIERPVQLFYATDRSLAEDPQQWPYYQSARGHLLRLGQADISMSGGDYDWEQIKEISLQRNRPSKYSLEISGVNDIGILDLSADYLDAVWFDQAPDLNPRLAYTEAINRRLANSVKKDIYIYTHGYRVNFDYPLLVSGELWHFLGYQGVFIAYSWPATPSAFAYSSDLESARYSSRNFRLFLQYLAEYTDVENIHIIGYSAGNRVILDALWQMAVSHPDDSPERLRERYRIGEVMIMASDYDANLFYSAVKEGILNVPERMSIYRSRTDRALGFSSWLLSRNRLGEIRNDAALTLKQSEQLKPNQNLVLIDVSKAEQAGSGKGHDYFRNSPWVSSDVLMTLRYDLPPEKRGLTREEGMATWEFPEDYIDRLRQSLETIH
jgi:esterase/lipase superfamily enzyme